MIYIFIGIVIAMAIFVLAIWQESKELEHWISEGDRILLGKENHGSNTNTKG